MLALLLVVLAAGTLSAQEIVAEGKYQPSANSGAGSPHRHWILTTGRSGGYLLRSEIQSAADGIRVVQLEEMNDRFVPTSIGYELYLKNHTEPDVVVSCTFAHNSITCDGKSEKGKAKQSRPYRPKGPFLLAVRHLSRFDFAWLAAGALNMYLQDSGKPSIRTIHLTGGAALELTDDISIAALQGVMTPNQKFTAIRPESYTEWEFISDDADKEAITAAGTEEIQLDGTKVSTRHYLLISGDVTIHFWLAQPGLLVKVSAGEGVDYVLTNYRQHRKLIAEVDVETPARSPDDQLK